MEEQFKATLAEEATKTCAENGCQSQGTRYR